MIAQQDWIRIKAHINNSLMNGIVSAGTLAELQRLQDRPESVLAVLLEGINYDRISGWGIEPSLYVPCLSYDTANKTALFILPQPGGIIVVRFNYMGSLATCETLAILEEASQTWPVRLRKESDTGYLYFQNTQNVRTYVAVDGKYVSVTLDSDDAIETLAVTDVTIPEGAAFVNITEADFMKLIGAPRVL